MNTLHYTVEFRNRDTGYWTEEASFKPDYNITTTTQTRRLIWFVWERSVTKCHNEDAAEKEARIRALKAAKLLREKDVRVRVCEESKNYDWWDTIWINGEFKDC